MRISASMPSRPRKRRSRRSIAHTSASSDTHTISAELLNGLRVAGIEVPEEVQDAVELTGFAWEARYPGTAEPASEEEYRRAVALAERVVHWAETHVEGKTQ